jgi:hypothetical protein
MDPMRQWLDEVRAQRQAWEARRQAAKDAVNARRRLNDPWGAAEHEAREKESQRRRDAVLERAERDRDAFLGQPPWENANLWESGPPPPLPGQRTTPEASPQPDAVGSNNPAPSPAQTPGEQRGDPAPYSPSGWDNRWYYRGY